MKAINTITKITPAMLAQIDAVAELESRTRADIMREAMRRYLRQFAVENPQEWLKITGEK
jgi:metal-responsive CopG/Arc/MetJ family transcriptional regulator